jgi:hypothetical protein
MEKEQWEPSKVDGRIIIRCIFRKWDVLVMTGFGWRRLDTCGRHLGIR